MKHTAYSGQVYVILFDDGVLKVGRGNKASAIHNGYFKVKTGESNSHAFHQTRFTPKGISWITKKLGLTD